MALKPLLSFSSGELDPVLHDNVTLEKFNKGLETARNVIISKTGSITSRFPRKFFRQPKYPDGYVRLYSPPHSDILIEIGVDKHDDNGYVRVSYTDGRRIQGTSYHYVDITHSYSKQQLEKLHVTSAPNSLYGSSNGSVIVYFFIDGSGVSAFTIDSNMYTIQWVPNPFFEHVPPRTLTLFSGNGTGYQVDYLATAVIDGQESLFIEDSMSPKAKKPINASETNILAVTWSPGDYGAFVSEIKIYSRPSGGGAYGYLGSMTKFTDIGGNVFNGNFLDQGQLPDYSQGVPDIVTNYGLSNKTIASLYSHTGMIYQQRLILTYNQDKEVIVASRPGKLNNFYRDFPYDADSALMFRTGSNGNCKIIRMIESDGLIVFTTTGVFINVGLLGPNNTLLEKKGSWVIKEDLPPLLVPGGVFFVDQSDTIRQLIFSQDIMAYESLEQSIFSNHLFREKVIKSWAYQEGNFPIIIVTFSDGTWATFTYNYEHQMKAWTRHDGVHPVIQVEGTGIPDKTFFVIDKNGEKQIEVSLPRYTPNDIIVEDPESVMKSPNALMDGCVDVFMKVQPDVWNEFSGMRIIVTPVTPDEWGGNLQFTVVYPNGTPFGDNAYTFMQSTDSECVGSTSQACTAALGDIGKIMRWFNPKDHSYIDFTVVEYIDRGTVIVEPSQEFPSEYADGLTPYVTYNEITGLDHLEGEEVSIMMDGSVLTSPNDIIDYAKFTVTGGKITLPEGVYGAIFIIGRPVIADVETLNMSTVEQSPVTLESLTVNKLYIKVFKSRGLYVGPIFPETKYEEKDGSSVKGMESLDKRLVPEYNPLLGNVYAKPLTMRIEKNIIGSWKSQGKICIRQVDPLHFEIVSIIPDVEISRRSDR